jgi:uncharacterized protein YdhG (YjbR/CyaY superfamily)
MPKQKNTNEVDVYISTFPVATQKLLTELRLLIKNILPNATEVISYKMPAYDYYGIVVYFAGYKNHIGFYPTRSGIANFQGEIAAYKKSKGAVQFLLDKPLPVKLITKIVRFRAKENLTRVGAKV